MKYRIDKHSTFRYLVLLLTSIFYYSAMHGQCKCYKDFDIVKIEGVDEIKCPKGKKDHIRIFGGSTGQPDSVEFITRATRRPLKMLKIEENVYSSNLLFNKIKSHLVYVDTFVYYNNDTLVIKRTSWEFDWSKLQPVFNAEQGGYIEVYYYDEDNYLKNMTHHAIGKDLDCLNEKSRTTYIKNFLLHDNPHSVAYYRKSYDNVFVTYTHNEGKEIEPKKISKQSFHAQNNSLFWTIFQDKTYRRNQRIPYEISLLGNYTKLKN